MPLAQHRMPSTYRLGGSACPRQDNWSRCVTILAVTWVALLAAGGRSVGDRRHVRGSLALDPSSPPSAHPQLTRPIAHDRAALRHRSDLWRPRRHLKPREKIANPAHAKNIADCDDIKATKIVLLAGLRQASSDDSR
jgi:hypothetical protein